MRYFLFLFVLLTNLSCVSVSGSTDPSQKGRHNKLVSVLRPMLPERLKGAYYHTLYDETRGAGDCQPYCPQVDIWQYQYLDHVSSAPISTQKAFWKSPDEARVISFSLFGKNPIYYQGLLDFLKSFQTLKRVNHITDPVWGFDTFIPRVYVPKGKNKVLEGELEDYQIQALLKAGCEIVFVDNGLNKAGKDATFWRFMIAAEPMPKGQKIRYLLRDADWIMTAAEAFAVGEWIASGKQYHRTHLVSLCMGPLTASFWGGSHTGTGSFSDLGNYIATFPYRTKYGDDELFLRDIVWPKMKHSGSILTHISKAQRGWLFKMANPYEGSCEEPTKHYCNTINTNNECEDVYLPESMIYPEQQLFLRHGLAELEKTPIYFDMQLSTPRGQIVNRAFMVHSKNVLPSKARRNRLESHRPAHRSH
ncbi:MAG: hypothetical protein WCK42_03835 [Myxococcaceae bacterium]